MVSHGKRLLFSFTFCGYLTFLRYYVILQASLLFPHSSVDLPVAISTHDTLPLPAVLQFVVLLGFCWYSKHYSSFFRYICYPLTDTDGLQLFHYSYFPFPVIFALF